MTNEYSWVRLPTASPSAVRLPLELIGKPCVRPAVTLQMPTARSSALASISCRAGRRRPRAQHVVGEGDDRDPNGRDHQRRQFVHRHIWHSRVGSPDGTWPTTTMPTASNDKTATNAVATSTAISGPGTRGAHCASSSNSARTDAPTRASANVAGRARRRKSVPGRRTRRPHRRAGDLAELAADHHDGDPGHVSDQHRLGQQLCQKAQSAMTAEKTHHAHHHRESGRQRGVALRVSRGDWGQPAAVISAVVDSGPTDSCRDDPSSA